MKFFGCCEVLCVEEEAGITKPGKTALVVVADVPHERHVISMENLSCLQPAVTTDHQSEISVDAEDSSDKVLMR